MLKPCKVPWSTVCHLFVQEVNFTINIYMTLSPPQFHSCWTRGKRSKDPIDLLYGCSKDSGFHMAAVCLSWAQGSDRKLISIPRVPLLLCADHRAPQNAAVESGPAMRARLSGGCVAHCILHSLLALQPFDTNTSRYCEHNAGSSNPHNHWEK